MNLARRQTQLPQKMSSFFQFLHQKPWESTWIHELKSNHAVKRVRSRTFISSLNLMHTGLGLSTYLELFCRSFAFDISRWLAIWIFDASILDVGFTYFFLFDQFEVVISKVEHWYFCGASNTLVNLGSHAFLCTVHMCKLQYPSSRPLK